MSWLCKLGRAGQTVPMTGIPETAAGAALPGDPAYLYQDWLIALDAARGINIGEPGLHARCLDALALREGEEVLHVGAGAGLLHGGHRAPPRPTRARPRL